MKRKYSVLAGILAALTIATVAAPMTVFAAEATTTAEEEAQKQSVLTLSVDGKVYENVTGGSVVYTGGKDIDDVNIQVLAYNGNALENVGTKSGVLDSQGRTVLEFNATETGKGVWSVRMFFHAQDDPIPANQAHAFEIVNIIFKTNKEASAVKVTSPAVKNLKATAKTKAAKVTWSTSKATGYQLQYSTTKSGLSKAKTISTKKNTYTIQKLKSKKTYYVRVRSYKSYTDALGNAKKAYSAWSIVKVTAK